MTAQKENSDTILMFGSVDPGKCNAATLHLTGLANAFQADGKRVILLAPESDEGSEFKKMLHEDVVLTEFACPAPPLAGRTIWSLGPIYAALKMLRILKQEQVDFFYARSGLLTVLLQMICRLKSVYSISEHNGIFREEIKLPPLLDKTFGVLVSWLQVLDCYFSTMARVVTPVMIGRFEQLGVAREKLFYCGNASNLVPSDIVERTAALDFFELDHRKTYIGFLGTLKWWQGVHHLVEAFPFALKSNPNLMLLIGGDGTERAALEKQAAELGVSHAVKFFGHVGNDARAYFLSAIDIGTLPAVRQRNEELGVSPLKIRDYLSMERMVIAANLPGLEEMHEAGAIILHEPDNNEDIANLIVKYANDPDARLRIAQTGAKFAADHFSWKQAVDKIASSLKN